MVTYSGATVADAICEVNRMDDLISRQAAIEVIQNTKYGGSAARKVLFVKALKQLPSANVVEAVICKDCKYNCFNSEAGIAKCCLFHAKTNLYGYCYLGER